MSSYPNGAASTAIAAAASIGQLFATAKAWQAGTGDSSNEWCTRCGVLRIRKKMNRKPVTQDTFRADLDFDELTF
jgi:hypothetical protein